MQTLPVNNNAETVTGSENDFLRELPVELKEKGVLPESVWLALSVEQKKDILRQNGLLERYSGPSAETVPASVEDMGSPVEQPTESQVSVVENVKPSNSEIAKLTEQLMESERKFQESSTKVEDKPVMSQEEEKRVAEETAKSSNTMNPPKLFGYQVSSNTVQNANSLSDNGDTEDGSTWAATLIKKIFAIFGE